MQITETLNEGLKREYQVVVEAADIEGRVSGKLTDLAKQVRLPGFRPGKAPVALLRKTYGKQVLGEVLQETVNETTTRTLEQNELKPAMQPSIEITRFDEGTDLEYRIAVEVMPVIETMDFSELAIERPVAEIGQGMVDERLVQLAEGARQYEAAPEDREAQEGDRVAVDFEGRLDGTPFDGGSATDFDIVLGSGGRIPGFDENLTGVKAGDQRSFEVTFPDDYGAQHLAGKTVTFDVTVKRVEVPLATAIDDALAQQLGMQTLAELKEALRGMMQRDYARLSRAKTKRALLDALAGRYSFEVPPGMVRMEFDSIWNQVVEDLKRQDKTEADLDKPEEEAKAEYRAIAERRVRLGLLLADVGQRNDITVTQQELNGAIAEQARNFPGQERQVLEFYRKQPEAQAQLRAPILEDKVCDFILEMATVTEKPVTVEELMREDDDEETGGPQAAG